MYTHMFSYYKPNMVLVETSDNRREHKEENQSQWKSQEAVEASVTSCLLGLDTGPFLSSLHLFISLYLSAAVTFSQHTDASTHTHIQNYGASSVGV